MKIDLHVHCKERSACSIATEIEQIESAIKYGLDAIVITDHDRFIPENRLEELNKKYAPFKIYGGIEIRTVPNGDDVIVIGVKDKEIEQRKWTYEALHQYVKDRNGFIVLCHPYRFSNTVNIDIATFVPDAIEYHSTNIGATDEEKIKTLANRLGTKLVANSDGHNSIHIGIYHNVIESTCPETEQELAHILLNKDISIGKDIDRIKEFNQSVQKRESKIKDMILEGKTAEDYQNLTGDWRGNFDRVMMGKSYEI